ncbi:MAG: MinD/ParA family protein [Deltaproteobacteria bacterium]|nr:MinD/ParA family protein [Deltaproteobacteria bacterium]
MTAFSHFKLWSIGGGKGGVGKSVFTLGLGIALARLGKRVILVDGDLGGANLHTMVGLRYPPHTLEDFLLKKAPRLQDLVLDTPIAGVGLLCGADDMLGAANPTYFQKIRLLRELETLPVDFVLIDLGAGTSFNTLDLFNHSPGRIAVFTGLSTSLQNAYGFIKCALFRKLSREFSRQIEVLQLLYEESAFGDRTTACMDDLLKKIRRAAPEQWFRLAKVIKSYQVYLVTNMVKNDQDMMSAEIIRSVCEDFLNLHTEVLGHVLHDPIAEVAINQMVPSLLYERQNRLATGFTSIAKRILRLSRRLPGSKGPARKEEEQAPVVEVRREA